jgi:hypothetical protein
MVWTPPQVKETIPHPAAAHGGANAWRRGAPSMTASPCGPSFRHGFGTSKAMLPTHAAGRFRFAGARKKAPAESFSFATTKLRRLRAVSREFSPCFQAFPPCGVGISAYI